MRWAQARNPHICSYCIGNIKSGEVYLSGAYRSFCKKCGKKYDKGLIQFSNKDNSYIDVKDKETCSYCKDPPIGVIKGKAVCQEHIGKVIEL